MTSFRHPFLKSGQMLALSALCACAAAPGGGQNTLTGRSASVAGPAQCAPEATPQGGIGCEWTNAAGNRTFLTLDEQPLSVDEPVAGATERLAAALNAFNARLATYPGFEGMNVIPDSATASPEAAWTCAFYAYSQSVVSLPEAPGQTVKTRGFGKLCVDAEGPSDSGRVVIAELSETWNPTMGGAPLETTPGDAQRIMGTLRLG